MSITLTDGVTTLALDDDLSWEDEYQWAQVEQSVDRSVNGALVIDVGVKSKGRPITLTSSDDESAWMSSAVLTQLMAWEADPDLVLTLDLRGRVFSVVFRRHDDLPIDARPVVFVADPLPGGFGDWWIATVRFMEV